MKEDLELEVRIPEWVKQEDVRCMVNSKNIKIAMDGRYVKAGKVEKDNTVTIEFPIHERTETIIVENQKYRVIIRGNDVVSIDPPGENGPLYQRGHYRSGETLWKKTVRFAPDKEIKWS